MDHPTISRRKTARSDRSRSTAWRARRWLLGRWVVRRWLALLPIAAVIAAGTAAAMVSFGAADRTSAVYGEYLERSDAGDVQINPAFDTAEIGAVIRSLPDVEQVTSLVLLQVGLGSEPRTRRQVEGGDAPSGGTGAQGDLGTAATQAEDGPVDDGPVIVGVFGSADGRFVAMDRPVVREGRLATGPNEMMLNPDAARALGLSVGDVVPDVSFWEGTWTDPSTVLDVDDDGVDAYWNEVVEPLGVENLTVVGVVTFADEVITDALFPIGRVVVSPDVAARYDCTGSEYPAGATWAEALAAASDRSNCAVLYRYYSVSVAGGCSTCVLDAVSAEMIDRNVRLRDISDLDQRNEARAAAGLGPLDRVQYSMIPVETRREAARLAQAIRPTVTALVVVGAVAAALTVALAGLLAVREVRRSETTQREWLRLGVSSADRAVVVAIPIVAVTIVGGLVGALVAWWLSPGPVGPVGVVAPASSRYLAPTAILAALTIAAAAVLVATGLAVAAARRCGQRGLATAAATSPPRHGALRSVRTLPPAVADGLRSALAARSTPPVVAGIGALVAVVVAAAVFAVSLSSLVATPSSYGWPWDTAVLTGAGYGGLVVEDASSEVDGETIEVRSDLAALDADPAVERLTVLALTNDVSLGEGSETTVIRLGDGSGGLTVLDGRLPGARDEVALGSTTAAVHGVDIGDTIEVTRTVDPSEPPQTITATVTGIVVFPVLGQLESEHVAAGTGVLLPEASVGREYALFRATFVGVELAEGAAAADRARVEGLARQFNEAVVFDAAVRPSQIVDTGSVRSVPATVAAVFAALAAIALTAATWATVRNRRHHLSVLRALGFDDTQVRSTVTTHALATAVAALAIGLPAGVVAGRMLWRTFATELGVVPDPAPAWGVLALVVVATVIVGVAAAVLPARTAIRTLPADHLTQV